MASGLRPQQVPTQGLLDSPCGCVCTSTFLTGTDGCLPAGCAVSATVNEGACSYRVFRDGVASQCDPPKPCPGVYSSGYNPADVYIFDTDSDDEGNECRCIDVDWDVNTGTFPCTLYIHSVAYDGDYETPSVWACSGTNSAGGTWDYRGDVGSSITQIYYFPTTEVGDHFSVVARQNYTGRTGCNYNFEISCEDIQSVQCLLVPLLDAIEYKLDNIGTGGPGPGTSRVMGSMRLR
jgi:hypothetical protein